MSSISLKSRVGVVLLLGCVACERGPGDGLDPRPTGVVPARGVNAVPVPVVIQGESFHPAVVQRIGAGPPLERNERFEAYLGDTALGEVRWRDTEHLEAVVPAGVPEGWQDLTVVSPLGRRVRLERAYFSSGQPFSVLVGSVSVSRLDPVVGEPLDVTLDVRNSGDATAIEVQPTLALEGTGGASVVAAPRPADVPVGESTRFRWTLSATGAGHLQLRMGASGLDSESRQPVALAPLLSPPLRVRAPAGLSAQLDASPALVNEGQPFTLSLTVRNTGDVTALGVEPLSPVLSGTSTPALVSGPTPAIVELAGGSSQVFTWRYLAGAAGVASFTASAKGTDASSLAPVSSSAAGPASVAAQVAASLTASLSTSRSRVNVGQSFTATLVVSDPGDTAALGVAPSALASGGSGAATVTSGPLPTSSTVEGHGSRSFDWTLLATSAGAVTFSTAATGTDQLDGTTVSSPSSSASVTVDTPAVLAASLSIPAGIGLRLPFTVTMTVSNTGTADAVAVAPSALSLSGAGAATLVSGPTPASLSIAGGSSASFSWVYSADALGMVTFTGGAAGADGNTGAPVSSAPATSNAGAIEELTQVLADPFGDGTSFSFVFQYDGKIYLGPSASGTGGVRFNPDGSGAQSFAFSFHKDVTTGDTSSNSSPAPYPSIGATGCAANTPACGPDNENGRGLFFSGVIGGQEWLAVGGGRSSGNLSYIYMTRDLGSPLTFSYVDLSNMLGSSTKGISSAIVFNGTVYLGFPDTGGSRPYLVALYRPPTPPGVDALSSADAESLDGDKMPGIGSGNSAPMNMIDSMAVFADRLYLANNGGCIRSTTTTPRRYSLAPGDWVSCKPSAGAYMARMSVTTTQTADLEPADKAVPQMAVFGGRLFLARNTTLGPQLFACHPASSAPVEHCDPGDWYLVAPDPAGSVQTRFDNPANVAVTLLVATSRHLYVGFNNAGGLVLFRTANPLATTRADFQGYAGCAADLHPGSCEGLGRNGLGVGVTRIFDGVATTSGASDSVYFTAGTGSTAVRLFRVSD